METTKSFKEKLNFYIKKLLPLHFHGKNKITFILNTIAGSIHPVMAVLILSYILDYVKNPTASVDKVIIYTATYSLLYAVLSIIHSLMINRAQAEITEHRMDVLHDTALKVTEMDYQLFESPDFNLMIHKAFMGIGGDGFGLHKIFENTNDLAPRIITAIIFSIILIKKSAIFVIITILGLFINLYLSSRDADYIYQHKDEREEENKKLAVYKNLTRDFTYGKDIRIYSLKDNLFANIKIFISKLIRINEKINFNTFKLNIARNFALNLAFLLNYALLVWLLFQGRVSSSELVMLITLVSVFSATIDRISEAVSSINEMVPYVMDSFEFLESDMNMNKNTKDVKFQGPVSIKFENVSFKYPGSENYVFKDLSFEIESGKKVAIIGVNGAGKTTIVKLLTGLLKAETGKIYINEQDISELSDKSLFAIFSAVFQDIEPMAMTIAENVAVSIDDIDYDRVEDCLKTVGLWEKVSTFEKSYNSQMLKVLYEDGVILSGGENQKLMIARALYKQGASVMIMDEPTAALDAFAEEKIYQEFDSYMGNKTGIFISHRLASTKFCDEILFLDDGQIVSVGDHKTLMEECIQYKEMFERQSKYYKEAENE